VLPSPSHVQHRKQTEIYPLPTILPTGHHSSVFAQNSAGYQIPAGPAALNEAA
jgi:hypothetical protein